MLELLGTLTQITPVQTVGNNGNQKKFIIVHEDGQYGKDVAFELFGKNLNIADQIPIGQHVRVCFNVASREYNGKWYNDISAYRVESADAKPQQPQATPTQQPVQAAHSVPQYNGAAAQQPYAAPVQSQNATDADSLPF